MCIARLTDIVSVARELPEFVLDPKQREKTNMKVTKLWMMSENSFENVPNTNFFTEPSPC